MTGAEPRSRFLCDAMLGSLARWLRFFGFDCEFADVTLSDAEVAARAVEQDRWLLTKDRELATTGPPRCVLITADGLDAQLAELFARLDLRPEPSLSGSRCAECNGELIDVDRDRVADVVPPYVLRTADRFRRCAACGRVYWPGTHGDRILQRLARVRELGDRKTGGR